MMDEDAGTLTPVTLISDYVAPILDSMVSEIEMNRQAVIQTNDRVSLALMMAEKTFLGDILTSIAEHFSTVVEELPEEVDPESKMGVAVVEIQDLLATWMSFDLEDEDISDDFEDGELEEEYDDTEEGELSEEDNVVESEVSDTEVLEEEEVFDAES